MSEVVSTLQRNTAKPKFSFWSRPTEPFLGSVDVSSFQVQRNINYRNSFIPIVHGKYEPAGKTTMIHLRLRPHTVVLVFMALWFGGVGLASLMVTIAAVYTKHFPSLPTLIPFGMLVFGYALVMGGFLVERGRTLDGLKHLLSAERMEPMT